MKLLVPSNLDLKSLIESFAPLLVNKRVKKNGKQHFKVVELSADDLLRFIPYCQYIIHLILSADDSRKYNGYVNLHTHELNAIGNHRRIPCLDLLSQLKVIEINDTYSVGDFSYSYRLGSRYFNTGVLTVEVEGLNICGVLNENESSYSLPNVIHQIHNNTTPYVSTPELNKCLKYQWNQLLNLKESFSTPPYLKVSKKVGRVFTNFTGFKKEIRNDVMKELDLVSIDFKSSNLHHFLQLVKEQSKTTPLVDELVYECDTLLSYLLTGGAYEWIKSMYDTDYTTDITRDEAKAILLRRLLNNYGGDKHLKSRWIKSKFPAITEFINNYNRDNKNQLSIDLMKAESYLVHNLIMTKVVESNHFNNSNLFVVHDAIFINRNYMDQLNNIMKEVSEIYFEWNVEFGIEYPKVENTIQIEIPIAEVKEQVEIIQPALLHDRFKIFFKENMEMLYDCGIIDSKRMYRDDMLSKILERICNDENVFRMLCNYGIQPNDIKSYHTTKYDSFRNFSYPVEKFYIKEKIETKKEIEIELEPEMVELRRKIDLVFS